MILKKIESLNSKLREILDENNLNNYIKNLLSRLSVKCESKQVITKRIFNTTINSNYLDNRIEVIDNKFSFSFQGKDFELLLNDKMNKINILINEFSTNIFFNSKNIFNYRINDLISSNKQNNYTFIIRNNIIYLYKNKTKLILGIRLPEIFNIEKLSIRTFNKDSWWIC